jgi:hypothetical protein
MEIRGEPSSLRAVLAGKKGRAKKQGKILNMAVRGEYL